MYDSTYHWCVVPKLDIYAVHKYINLHLTLSTFLSSIYDKMYVIVLLRTFYLIGTTALSVPTIIEFLN